MRVSSILGALEHEENRCGMEDMNLERWEELPWPPSAFAFRVTLGQEATKRTWSQKTQQKMLFSVSSNVTLASS